MEKDKYIEKLRDEWKEKRCKSCKRKERCKEINLSNLCLAGFMEDKLYTRSKELDKKWEDGYHAGITHAQERIDALGKELESVRSAVDEIGSILLKMHNGAEYKIAVDFRQCKNKKELIKEFHNACMIYIKYKKENNNE
jgi:hypothetical protein